METKKIKWGDQIQEHYKPERNKKKLLLVGAFVVGCLVTPATNWLLIPMVKFLNKSLWLYR